MRFVAVAGVPIIVSDGPAKNGIRRGIVMEEPLLLNIGDGVAKITLNRPEKLNSFNTNMHAALSRALDQVENDGTVRAVLLTGSGRAFCTGQDLGERLELVKSGQPIDLGDRLRERYNPLVSRIRSFSKPTVCAVNGVAAGAGVSVALSCDVVVAAESARFILAFSKVGLIPDAGATWMLPRLIGEARTRAMAMTGEPVLAKDALRWGMIWRVVADAELMENAHTLAKSLADGPSAALRMTKKVIQESAVTSFEDQLEREADYQQNVGRLPDYVEGVSAFIEKRKPNFQ